MREQTTLAFIMVVLFLIPLTIAYIKTRRMLKTALREQGELFVILDQYDAAVRKEDWFKTKELWDEYTVALSERTV